MKNGIKVLTYKKVCVINYRLNNISSVVKALKEYEIKFDLIEDGKELDNYSHIIIPGIGSFDAGVAQLKLQNFYDKLCNLKKSIKILGICLGMQLLFEESEESSKKSINGLSLIKGKVKKMDQSISKKVYIPHIGWNKIDLKLDVKNIKIKTDKDFYFANSYYVEPVDQNIVKYVFRHGKNYPAIVQHDNCYGFQFHPEKSGNGINILKDFCNLD